MPRVPRSFWEDTAMVSDRQSGVKIHPRHLREAIREVAAFEDVVRGVIEECGVREALRFVHAMIEDGIIPRLDGQRLKARVREYGKALPA